MSGFASLQVGNTVIAYDEYSTDYEEHKIRIRSKKEDKKYITETNPKGIVYSGEDLVYKNYGDCIGYVHEGNFVRCIS